MTHFVSLNFIADAKWNVVPQPYKEGYIEPLTGLRTNPIFFQRLHAWLLVLTGTYVRINIFVFSLIYISSFIKITSARREWNEFELSLNK